MKPRNDVADFPVDQVVGIGDLFWRLRYRRWLKNSPGWRSVLGTIERRYLLRVASNTGWFCVAYSYAWEQDVFSGELRIWISSPPFTQIETYPATIAFSRRFPPGSLLQVRVDPNHPDHSVAESPAP
jgi:hypothetical protein